MSQKPAFLLMGIILLTFIASPSFPQGRHPLQLGNGVVAIGDTFNQTRVLPIYKDKNLTNKIEDFRLYGKLANVWPFYYKPDYGICYFICLERQSNCYRILINDSIEGYLTNIDDYQYKSWESVLINNSVERLDLKTNPLREKPNAIAKTIDVPSTDKPDRLTVIEVVEVKNEYWIKVNYSKSGKESCDKGTTDCREGWIKWREGNKLLVTILLLD